MATTWTLYAFDEADLRHFVGEVTRIVDERDALSWKELYKWLETLEAYGAPMTKLEHTHGLPDLSADVVPEASSPSFETLFRTAILHRALLRSPSATMRPWAHFVLGDIPREFTGRMKEVHQLFCDWIIQGNVVPEPFDVLHHRDGRHALLLPERIEMLLAANAECQMLETFERQCRETDDGFEDDLKELRELMERAVKSGWVLYYYEV